MKSDYLILYICLSVCSSVLLSSWNNSTPVGRIFLVFCYYVPVLVKIEKNNVINEDLHTFMADSVNSVTIYLPSLPYLPRLSEFISLLKLCKRAVIAVLTFHNFFHLMWFVHKR